jgi:hypothetical protein
MLPGPLQRELMFYGRSFVLATTGHLPVWRRGPWLVTQAGIAIGGLARVSVEPHPGLFV